jgi:hypothetical protein
MKAIGDMAGEVADMKATGDMTQDSSQIKADSAAGKQIVQAARSGEEEVQEEGFDFDPSTEEETRAPTWFAMARYYSRILNPKGLFEEMGAAWRLKTPITVQKLGDNIFILEFDSEPHYKYALNGGPWRHKGDALIVVPYDGFSRPLEIDINSINMWVRFYDVSVTLMSPTFTIALAKKVSTEVLEVGDPVRDFLRARVALHLEDPLKPLVELKIKRKGEMSFEVRYENTPFFCFTCGRMGHSERECPKEEEDSDEEEELQTAPKKKKFGDWLRKSPPKRGEESKIIIPAAPSRVNHALNFSGVQLSKMRGAVTASFENGAKRKGQEGVPTPKQQPTYPSDVTPKKLPSEVSNALSLMTGRVSVKEGRWDLNVSLAVMKDKVSGLDSFADSSEQSDSRNLHDRPLVPKPHLPKGTVEWKLSLKVPSRKEEINKHKKPRMNDANEEVVKHMMVEHGKAPSPMDIMMGDAPGALQGVSAHMRGVKECMLHTRWPSASLMT